MHIKKHQIRKLKHVTFMPLSSHRSDSWTTLFSSLSIFKIWSEILLLWILSPSAPNLEETLIVATKQGGTAEAAIGASRDAGTDVTPCLQSAMQPLGL